VTNGLVVIHLSFNDSRYVSVAYVNEFDKLEMPCCSWGGHVESAHLIHWRC